MRSHCKLAGLSTLTLSCARLMLRHEATIVVTVSKGFIRKVVLMQTRRGLASMDEREDASSFYRNGRIWAPPE